MPAKPLRQKKREIHYLLDRKKDGSEVFLVKRARDASLMPGMWELPEATGTNGDNPLFTLRHSITVTDYTVRVWRSEAPSSAQGKWIPAERLGQFALTGLARKILRKAQML
jgi:adenine-specific DNA glycosylase